MRMGQGVRTGLGHGASPVSYRHNFLVHSVLLWVCLYFRLVFIYRPHLEVLNLCIQTVTYDLSNLIKIITNVVL